MAETRYSRQVLLPQIGPAGQDRFARAAVALVGCGALGTAVAGRLVRAGVGNVRIIDRDFVELDNLQCQVLFDEEDAAQSLPKAVAAARKLARANSAVRVEALVRDLNRRNVEELIAGCAVVLDATDNMETRFLLNDASLKLRVPWVYGAVVGTCGATMSIVPGRTACLRCLLSRAPAPGALPTCDRAGALGPAAGVVACLQAAAALRLLVGGQGTEGRLTIVDAWAAECETVQVERVEGCPACVLGRFDYLAGAGATRTASLCGRNAVQILPPEDLPLDLEALAASLATCGQATFNGYLLRLRLPEQELIVFPTGRAIVKGTADESVARTLYARYVGA